MAKAKSHEFTLRPLCSHFAELTAKNHRLTIRFLGRLCHETPQGAVAALVELLERKNSLAWPRRGH